MSDWAGIKKAINSDLSKPLNKLIERKDNATRYVCGTITGSTNEQTLLKITGEGLLEQLNIDSHDQYKYDVIIDGVQYGINEIKTLKKSCWINTSFITGAAYLSGACYPIVPWAVNNNISSSLYFIRSIPFYSDDNTFNGAINTFAFPINSNEATSFLVYSPNGFKFKNSLEIKATLSSNASYPLSYGIFYRLYD